MVEMKKLLYAGTAALGFAVLLSGCAKNNGPAGTSGSGVPVNLSLSFSKSSSSVAMLKTSGLSAADSLRIDSAVVVISRFELLRNEDSTKVDTTGGDSHDGLDEDELTFKGPFVVWVRDTMVVNLGGQLIPAGNYNGLKFKIHRLQDGEQHHDVDDHRHPGHVDKDSSVTGSSVVVWGAVLKNGVWTPFTINADMEIEYKIKGNFVVAEAMGNVKIALNFNLGLWFKDPYTGAFLDPTDTSMMNQQLIRKAIRFAFGQGHGGHDHNDDGHPDD